jgi:hypothetical protein
MAGISCATLLVNLQRSDQVTSEKVRFLRVRSLVRRWSSDARPAWRELETLGTMECSGNWKASFLLGMGEIPITRHHNA